MPRFLDDPAEPVNRGVWAINRVALEGIVHPVGRVYRAIVPDRVRQSVGHAGTNVLFPGRFINEMLQGRWKDAGDESLRFLTNTTVGVAGLFDVASQWNMPQPRADFSETFQQWGYRPQTYLMLPLLGPSDQSSAVASVFDRASDPLFYVGDAWPASATFSAHRLTKSSDETVRAIRATPDPYSFSHLAWSYMSRRDAPDWTLRGSPDMPTLETLGAAAIRFQDPQFPNKGREAKVRIPSTGRRLPFQFWIQRNPAPLAYVLPGLGSHRLSGTSLAMAEHLHASGFSVVTLASAFHPEFMESASTSPLPGIIANDSQDVWNALVEIDAHMAKRYPGRITRRALVGASMGGYQTLVLSSLRKSKPDPRLSLDAFLAINPPVDLHYGVKIIDEFYQAPVNWSPDERQDRIDNAVHKVGGLSAIQPSDLTGPPFDGVESKYLIGLNFRFTLRDALYSAETRYHLGMTSQPPSAWDRKNAYRELLNISFSDYAATILAPHYLRQGMSLGALQRNRSLHNHTSALRNNPKAMVLTNQNDFLLRPQDRVWLKSTFGPSRLHMLPTGGHLGNIASPAIRLQIADLLKDLH
jgi:ABC-type transporter lipoprotein component MlaA